MGMGIKSISSAFHLSRNTVRKYVRKYQESGLTMEQMLSMSEDKLQDLFLDSKNRSRVPSPRRTELDALVPDYVKRLSKKGVSVKSLSLLLNSGMIVALARRFSVSSSMRIIRMQRWLCS